MKKWISRWYLLLVIGFPVLAGLVFLICGEDSIIAVHDNLDLFIPQFQMMKDTGTFWAHDASVPFLGGISRDTLPSEFYLYTILYMILPAYPAYVAGYLLKILIAVFSCVLLSKDVLGENYPKYKPLACLFGLAYGILNMFPAFAIPFASIPLVIWLVRRIYREPRAKWYLGLFFYPVLSYFSYFGLFILAYMAVALIWLWIRDKRFPARLLLAIAVLSAGCIACEYRLFGTMLFGEEETIRSTMAAGSMSAGEIISTIGDVFVNGMFHAESVHTYLVLPVCVIYFLYLNIHYVRIGNIKGIFHDLYNLFALVLVFNSVVYGIYYWEGFRTLVETICPPLTGWQFNRTVFFSPFIWYAAFFLVLKRLYDSRRRAAKPLANVLAVLAILVIVLSGTRYNDLYHTCKDQAHRLVKGTPTDEFSFREFYSEELFEKAKEDVGYNGEWAAAYGLYPAVLEYNEISTLDGYLGFYSQNYKEAFRAVIAPALERVEESRIYYDDWGARAYLYSGTEITSASAYRSYAPQPQELYIDTDAFKALGGRYIFSRMELTNAEEAGFELAGVYTDEASPYTLYVYRTQSRYQTKEHADVSFGEMQGLTYDKELLNQRITELEALAQEAEESGRAEEPEAVIEIYDTMLEELTKLATCSAVNEINYYKDVYDEVLQQKQEEIYADAVDIQDRAYIALKKLCNSPYRETMENVMDSGWVEVYAEYEELTDREKEIALEENSLLQEYEEAAGEEYTIEYKGEEWNFERFALEGDSLSGEDSIAVYQMLYEEKNSVLGEIFLQLVALRNEEAQLQGYDNYAEYMYSEGYTRDYSVEEAEELLEEIKKDAAPLVTEFEYAMMDMELSAAYEDRGLTAGEMLSNIHIYAEEIDPELGNSMEHLMEYEMYDFGNAPEKAQIGFTTQLPYYGDAFIFLCTDGSIADYLQMVHEFGHYSQSYYSTENILEAQSNLDVAEIHSQGLEMLFYDRYKDMLGEEDGELMEILEIYQIVAGIKETALTSDFEMQVYTHPNMTLEDMNKLYLNLSNQYGTYYVDQITEVYTWCETSHLFNAPCYFISYLTSALSSLDIYTLAQEDREYAEEIYMEITTLPSYVPYCSAVEEVGLRDIFEDGTAGEIVEEAAEAMELDKYLN